MLDVYHNEFGKAWLKNNLRAVLRITELERSVMQAVAAWRRLALDGAAATHWILNILEDAELTFTGISKYLSFIHSIYNRLTRSCMAQFWSTSSTNSLQDP